MPPFPFSDSDVERLIKGVYEGKINAENLPKKAWREMAEYLASGVDLGLLLGLEAETFTPVSEVMRRGLRDNVFIFSGAKTYQQVRELGGLMVNERGEKRSFDAFREDALKLHEDYNENWLRTEYNMAVRQGRAAGEWTRIEEDKDLYPYLKYITVGDGNVRPEHASLDGIIRAVDDSFWNTYMPPNDWGCRCTVEQVDEVPEGAKVEAEDNYAPLPLFQMNPGKDKVVFKGNHPYLMGYGRDKVEKAFGLVNNEGYDAEGYRQPDASVPNVWEHKDRNVTLQNGIDEEMTTALKFARMFPEKVVRLREEEIIYRNGKKCKSPDYLIDRQYADTKQQRGDENAKNFFTNNVKKASKQGSDVVILNLLESLEKEEVRNLAWRSLINAGRPVNKMIKRIYIFLPNGKNYIYDRSDLKLKTL